MGGALHSLSWLVWALSAAACVELAPNPLYVCVVIAAAAAVVAGHHTGSSLSRAFPLLLGFGIVFAGIRVVATALTAHSGGDALMTTPAVTLPAVLGGFTVGGDIETSVVLGAIAGSFAIVGVMAAFGAFNAVVSHHELVQAAPRAFYEAGLVLTISLAFVPSIITTAQRAREADRARLGGARPPRRRAFQLVVPVLESALERAIALSESMDSRGFGRGRPSRYERVGAATGVAGLLLLGAAFVALVSSHSVLAGATSMAGAVLIAVAVGLTSTGDTRRRHRRRAVSAIDAMVMLLSLAAPLTLTGLRYAGRDSMVWNAAGEWPPFDVSVAVALLLLAAPALIRPVGDPGVGAVSAPVSAQASA